ncbi:hypothetical protein BGZ95_004584, partial [Linnemannia exigua]
YLAAFKKTLIPGSGLDPYFVRSSLLRLYHEYRSAMWKECNRLSKPEILRHVTRYKGNDLPGFVSFITFKNIVNGHYLDGWRSVTEEHILKMHDHLSKALSMFISHIADASARDVFTHVFEQFSRAQATSIKTTIQDIFEDESTPFTLSRHYKDVVHKERSRNDTSPSLTRGLSVIDLNKDNSTSPIPSSFGSPPPSQTGSPESPQPMLNNDRTAPFSQNDPMSASYPSQDSFDSVHSSPQQHQQDNQWDDEHMAVEMLPCLLGYLTTARERIVDKVLMETIERHMINRITVFFTMVIKATNAELLCMLESPALKRRREDFANKITDFEVASIESTTQDIFEDESAPFTLNRHYLEVVHKERSKTIRIPLLTRHLSAVDLNKGSNSVLQNQDNTWDDEHMTVEMLPCPIGYLTTARERIVDKALMQTIERHMVKRINGYFTMLLKATNGDLACMLESPMLKRHLQDFENKITDFEAILNDL